MLLNFFAFILLIVKRTDNAQLHNINNFTYILKSNVILSYILIVVLFSMLGIPPLPGFFGKVFLFLNALNFGNYIISYTGLILSTVSCFYYLRLIKITNFNNTKN